jgi:multimeric flavodoxin WrbA
MVIVLGINGSPRPQGNTALLLDTFLRGAKDAGADTLRLDVSCMDISGCTECNGCKDTGACVLADEMVKVYQAIQQADVLVMATPLFFSGMSSQLKAVIDRCQCLWYLARRGELLERKSAYLLAVGAMEAANFRNVLSEVRSFCKGVGIVYKGEITVPGVDQEGDILSRPEELERAYSLGCEAGRATVGSR